MSKDMTRGNPLGLILKFFIPVLLGSVFQQFYSMVDTIVVGKFVGVNALAGVGSHRFHQLSDSGLRHGHHDRFWRQSGPALRSEETTKA